MQILLYFISVFSLVILVLIAVRAKSNFILFMILVKPFLDITVNVKLVRGMNSLEISGIFIFIVTGALFLQLRYKKIVINLANIWIFIMFYTVIIFLYIFLEGKSFKNIALLIKITEGYFIYFIAYQYLINYENRLRIYKYIWFSIIAVSIINIVAYFIGIYNIDITKGQIRIAGLYNDPGTPSYLIVIAIIFSTLFLELKGKQLKKIHRYLYFVSWIILLLIFYKTLTKSAFLMFIVFTFMWWGFHKKKLKLVIPVLTIFGFLIYTYLPRIQERISTDLNVLERGFEFENIRSLGTGRVNRWNMILDIYINELGNFEKLFGTSDAYGAHNQYLAFLMQVGLLGLSIFLVIIYKFLSEFIRIYRRTGDPEIFTGLLILVMYLVYGLTGHPFFYTTLLWYLMIMLGYINVYRFKAFADREGIVYNKKTGEKWQDFQRKK